MDWNDFIYACLLLISVPFGFVIKNQNDRRLRQIISSGTGLLMVIAVCRMDTFHSLITAVVNGIIISLLSPRISHLVSFAWCFGYVVFFRTTHYLGLPKVVPQANAVQLLMTLKLVGMAFEVHDTYMNSKAAKKEDANEKVKLQVKYQSIRPSFLDQMFYSYSYIGLLTGPYYKYRTYIDMVNNTQAKSIDVWPHLMERLTWLPFTAVGYVLLSTIFSIEYMKEDEFYEYSFLIRFVYMIPMFTVFRLRLYTAWLMSEVICITATLGAYPVVSKPRCGQGPYDLEALDKSEESAKNEVNFETIHNISMWGCDFAPTVREGMRSWNMSVQFWLAHHVYRRFPLKALRTSATMLVSAFWHGIHPGYYLSFLTIPPTVMAEDAMAAAFRSKDDTEQQRRYDWWSWFWKMRFLDYMAMGFLLLGGYDTLRYWASIYFVPHLVIIAFIVIGNIFKPTHLKSSASSTNPSTEKKTT